METVIGLLAVGSLFVVLFWAGAVHRHARPVAVRMRVEARTAARDTGPAATTLAVARAEGIAGIGRYGDRRCAH